MQEVQLYIDGVRIDLFNDETISVTQTIQNVRDIAKVFTDFSQTFTIPASKTNNKIFKHFYNYSIDNGFDARLKVDATIEINSLLFKKGKVRLDGVNFKNAVPYAYKITFFGNTVDLKDLLGEDKLSGLEALEDYNKVYSATNVRTALTAGYDINGYTDAIIAPLISHTERLFYDTSTSEVNSRNLWAVSGAPGIHQGVYYQDLKYAIRAHIIIKAIEQTYGITFSSDFFSTVNTDWYNLYLWLHRKKGGVFDGDTFTTLVTGLSPTGSGQDVTVQTDRILVFAFGYTPNIDYTLTTTTSSPQTYTVTIKKDGALYATKVCDNASSLSISGELISSSTGYQVFIEAASSFTVTTTWNITDFRNAETFTPSVAIALNSALEFIVTEQLPDMKVIDFLTGIFKMFNLTAYLSYSPTSTIVTVKTLDDFYADSSTTWNITEYINTDSGSVDAALPFKQVNLEYEGRSTKLAKKHGEVFNEEWGTLKYTGEDGSVYDSSPEIYSVTLPFEHMKYERLFDGNTSTTTAIQVGFCVDDNDQSYIGKPLLFYGVLHSGTTIRFLNDLSTGQTDISTYFVPSNSKSLSSATSPNNIHFNLEVNEYSFATDFTGTLFQNYYLGYLSSVFSLRKRISTFDAELPVSFLVQFSLADKLIIGTNTYVVNSIQTDLTTGKSKLELLNITTV